MGLNSEQKFAVETVDGPLLVLAGAGSGKTRVVTFRIVNLLEKGVPASQILGLTFTNKAANEMKERVHKLTQSNVLICTFHSLGARILRESIHHLGFQNNFAIYDEDDTEKLMKTCINAIPDAPLKLDLKALKGMISRAKNSLSEHSEGKTLRQRSPEEAIFPSLFATYQQKLKEYNSLDYDDLLYLPLRLFREHPEILQYYQDRWSHLLIDEYQDTNAVQYALVNHLVAKHRNLCVVGDPDQSIYSWRGANINNILNFESEYPDARVVKLNQNYRSRTNILDAANALIKSNSNRYEKHLWSDRGPGEKIKLFRGDNEREEALFVARQITHHRNAHTPLSEVVVFYRTNAQSRVFEDYFLQAGIPYVIVGGISFYQRREIKDILAWLRMVESDSDFISFARTINLPKRGIGDTTLEKIRQSAEANGEPILRYCVKLVAGDASLKLTAKQKQGLESYLSIIRELRQINEEGLISALVMKAIDSTGYQQVLEEDRETMADRKENLDALVSKAFEWETTTETPTLHAFLEELSLKSTLDDATAENDRVSLMTIHNGKGLEFDVAFLVGLEEDLFPHVNSRDDIDKLEEERRLCYVGMTRAKEYLYLSEVTARFMWGVTRTQRSSRFLREIPSEFIERIGRKPTQGYPKPFSSQRATMQPKQEPFINDMDQTIPEVNERAAFACGEMIFHKEFGIGRIQNMYDGSAGLTYQIFFTKDQSERTLVAKYATLKKL